MKKIAILFYFLGFVENILLSQNIGIGTTSPSNKLEVRGSLLVNEPVSFTTSLPTAGQTKTMTNGANTLFAATDSVYRLFDPGGPAGNYSNNQQATAEIPAGTGFIGIQFVLEDLQLGTGDSLIIKTYNALSYPTFMTFTNGSLPGNYTLNSPASYILFKSNADGNNGRGFSLLIHRIYASPGEVVAPKNFAGNHLFFDARKGALRLNGISNDSIGTGSVAFGGSKASGERSFAAGNSNASGAFSAALAGGKATGDLSFAAGPGTSSGDYSVSLGPATSGGFNSFAAGNSNATKDYAVAIGNGAALGLGSIAIGMGSVADKDYAVAIGKEPKARGIGSMAIGNDVTSDGTGSFGIGNSVESGGPGSFAIGNHVTADGSGSMVLGNYASTSGFIGCLTIGDNSTTTVMQTFVDNGFRSRFAGGYRLFTNSAATVGAFLNTNANSWAALSDVRLKENFLPVDGESFLRKIGAMPQYTWNYIGQDVKTLRHYGPMAQDFYKAFGNDSLGVIGCDTLINQQDFLGVNLISIQALEKRTTLLKEEAEQTRTLLLRRIELLEEQNKRLLKLLEEKENILYK